MIIENIAVTHAVLDMNILILHLNIFIFASWTQDFGMSFFLMHVLYKVLETH